MRQLPECGLLARSYHHFGSSDSLTVFSSYAIAFSSACYLIRWLVAIQEQIREKIGLRQVRWKLGQVGTTTLENLSETSTGQSL